MVVDEEGRDCAAERKARAEDALWPVRTTCSGPSAGRLLTFLFWNICLCPSVTRLHVANSVPTFCRAPVSSQHVQRASLCDTLTTTFLHNHLFACSSLDNELIHDTPTVRMTLANKSHGGQLSLRTHPRISCQGWPVGSCYL